MRVHCRCRNEARRRSFNLELAADLWFFRTSKNVRILESSPAIEVVVPGSVPAGLGAGNLPDLQITARGAHRHAPGPLSGLPRHSTLARERLR